MYDKKDDAIYIPTVLNMDYANKKIARIGLSSVSATLPKGTEIMILGR